MIKTIIVENEKQHSDFLSGKLAAHFPEIDVLAICIDVKSAVEKINMYHPQLIFLDVQLESNQTGFEVLEQTRNAGYEVIFTTSYNEHAVKAIKFSALDFLLKPFSQSDLQEAIERYKSKVENDSSKNISALLHNLKQTDKAVHKVGIPVLRGFDFITVAEIINCDADDNYTNLFLTSGKKIQASKNLKWIEDLLRDHNFFRVHDKYLINLNHIKNYTRGGEGGVVMLANGKEVDVSRRKKDDFIKRLSDLRMI
ncbi:MAG: LytTR family DNA-binding domain-containing protein [Bacteroidia bacterium]